MPDLSLLRGEVMVEMGACRTEASIIVSVAPATSGETRSLPGSLVPPPVRARIHAGSCGRLRVASRSR